MTIHGTNFTGVNSVKFNGTAAAFTFVTSVKVTAVVPTGATTGRITLSTPAGTATSATNFTITGAAPTITSFNPASGNVGTTVTIHGTNFTGVNSVKFNGTAAAFTFVTSVKVTAVVPTGATTGRITLSTPCRNGDQPDGIHGARRTLAHGLALAQWQTASRDRSGARERRLRRMPAVRAGGHQAVRRRALALDHDDVHGKTGPLPSDHPRSCRSVPSQSHQDPARERRDLQGRSVERSAPPSITVVDPGHETAGRSRVRDVCDFTKPVGPRAASSRRACAAGNSSTQLIKSVGSATRVRRGLRRPYGRWNATVNDWRDRHSHGGQPFA